MFGELGISNRRPVGLAVDRRGANARPLAAGVLAFLKANGIDYIYADTMHPNGLVPDATPVITGGSIQVLRIP